MPKKKPRSTDDEGEHERRPQNLTLGCFIKEAKPRGKKKLVESQGNASANQLDVEPASSLHKPTETGNISEIPMKERKNDTLQRIDRPRLTGCHSTNGPFEGMGASKTEEESLCEDWFEVMRTKKGGFPIYLEKRAKGKKVTVVRQVNGNSKVLLQLLKTKFGTGGLIKPGEVEIQGDFEDKLTKYFREHSHILVQYKSSK